MRRPITYQSTTLDDQVKTVSARQTETFEVLSYWFAIRAAGPFVQPLAVILSDNKIRNLRSTIDEPVIRKFTIAGMPAPVVCGGRHHSQAPGYPGDRER